MTNLVVRRTDVSDLGFGACPVRLDVPLLDDYLIFLAGRCRPNTVLATAYDLQVFFTLVGKAPRDVFPADVLAFIAAQRTGQSGPGLLRAVAGQAESTMSAPTVRRRLSSVSGLFSYLLARVDVTVNPVPRGLPTRRERHRPRQGVPLVKARRTLPRILEPTEVDALTAALRGTGTGRWSRRWCWAGCAAARSSAFGWRTCGSGTGRCSSQTARAGISGWCRFRARFFTVGFRVLPA